MTMSCSFSYNSLVNYMLKNFGSLNMVVLYPNPCYNKVCFKGTALYISSCPSVSQITCNWNLILFLIRCLTIMIISMSAKSIYIRSKCKKHPGIESA